MSATRVLRGLVLGALGGALGWLLPEMVFHLFLDPTPPNPVPNPESTLWGLGIVGALIGLSVGVPTLSGRKMRHGFIGGLFGGTLGGFAFQTLAEISRAVPLFQGPTLRLIGFSSIGGATGFFVSLVEEAFKQAWVKV